MHGLKHALVVAEANTRGKQSRPVYAIKKQIQTLELMKELSNDKRRS